MPQLDRFFAVLVQRNAQELRLVSGHQPVFDFEDGPKPASSARPTGEQLIALLRDVLPPGSTERLVEHNALELVFERPSMPPLSLRAQHYSGQVELRFRRASAEEIATRGQAASAPMPEVTPTGASTGGLPPLGGASTTGSTVAFGPAASEASAPGETAAPAAPAAAPAPVIAAPGAAPAATAAPGREGGHEAALAEGANSDEEGVLEEAFFDDPPAAARSSSRGRATTPPLYPPSAGGAAEPEGAQAFASGAQAALGALDGDPTPAPAAAGFPAADEGAGFAFDDEEPLGEAVAPRPAAPPRPAVPVSSADEGGGFELCDASDPLAGGTPPAAFALESPPPAEAAPSAGPTVATAPPAAAPTAPAAAPAPPANATASASATEPASAGPAPDPSEPPLAEAGTAKIDELFRLMVERGSSDLHLSSDEHPILRVDGEVVRITEWPKVDAEAMRALLWPIMPERYRAEWRESKDTDFAYEIEGLARFRANIFADRKGPGAVFRVIPSKILTAKQLGLSDKILDLCQLTKGLVLVTGPTGSGKSTTLTALIDHINKTRKDHIITIEDPIEFVHENIDCLVNQREVGVHTMGFKRALRAALREDPDIVLVGELRDLETIAIAIETAETGHLVFGTLHTTTAVSTVDRIIDQFPSDQQAQVRTMLSESLRGVIAQVLCKKKGGGRVAALEVLIGTPSVANLIREGKTFQIPSIMQTGKKFGMVTLNESLVSLVKQKLIEPKEAWLKAVDKTSIANSLRQAGADMSFLGAEAAPAGVR